MRRRRNAVSGVQSDRWEAAAGDAARIPDDAGHCWYSGSTKTGLRGVFPCFGVVTGKPNLAQHCVNEDSIAELRRTAPNCLELVSTHLLFGPFAFGNRANS